MGRNGVSDERRIALAKAMGWRVIEEHSYDESKGDLNRRAYVYLLTDPNGDRVLPRETFIDDFRTEADAWAAAPDIANDVAAGVVALDATGQGWELAHEAANDFYWCNIYIPNAITSNDDVEARGATPALAIFEALCSYYRVGESGT